MSQLPAVNFQTLLEKPMFRRTPLFVVGALAVALGWQRGVATGVLVLAGAFLLLALGLVWWSLRSLSGTSKLSLDEALSLARPSAEEEQKQSVLRALKDLEFERGVGKISDEDYRELSLHYRTEAKRLMALLDESHARRKAEVEDLARQSPRPTSAANAKKKRKPISAKLNDAEEPTQGEPVPKAEPVPEAEPALESTPKEAS